MIERMTLRNGVTQYTYWGDSNAPLGVAWVTFASSQSKKVVVFMLNTMVAYWHRREGVATALHEAIKLDSDIMISPSGSQEGGIELLKKTGFIYNQQLDMWVSIK